MFEWCVIKDYDLKCDMCKCLDYFLITGFCKNCGRSTNGKYLCSSCDFTHRACYTQGINGYYGYFLSVMHHTARQFRNMT